MLRLTKKNLFCNLSTLCLDRRAIEWLAYLKEDEIDLNQLENFLKDYLKKHPDVLNSNSATNFRRLIRIYDWLKYGK